MGIAFESKYYDKDFNNISLLHLFVIFVRPFKIIDKPLGHGKVIVNTLLRRIK